MSGTKRKRNAPLKLSEEKQTKMTWDMRDFRCNQANPLREPLAIDMHAQSASNNCSLTVSKNKIASPSKRSRKQELRDSVELQLDNSYPSTLFCKLGIFSVFLSTGSKHVQSPRHNPREECINIEEKRRLFNGNSSTFSKEILGSFDGREVGSYSTSTELDTFNVIVTLNLETQQLSTSEHVTKECSNLNSIEESDDLKELKFKACVPCVTMEMLDALVYLQSKRVLSLVLLPEETILTECWKVAVCLNECALTKVSFPSEVTTVKKVDKMINIIMSWFFDRFKETLPSQNCEVSMLDKGFGDVYDAVKEIQRTYLLNMEKSGSAKLSQQLNNDSLTEKGIDSPDKMFPREITSRAANCVKDLSNIQHPYLKPTLRKYQKKAVWWMLCKEQCQDTVLQEKVQCVSKLDSERREIHPLWKEIHTLDGKVIYYNPYTGRLSRERFRPPSLPLGGILADEMGLGKTVEVIACILNHPNPTSNENHSPQDIKGTSEDGAKLLKEKGYIQECTTSETNKCQHGRTLNCSCELCISKNKENKTDTAVDQRNIHCGYFIESSHLPDVLNAYHGDESLTQVSIDHFNHGMSDQMTESASTVKCHCICGSNDVNVFDSLLHCCSCQAVFHASCLPHVSSVDFYCPHCIVKQPAAPSRATLIISPAPIAQQWVEEISRHTKISALKLLVYEGVAKMGFIQPAVLADNDIILTTYSTLRADFYHLGPNQADGMRSLRYEKRYIALPSPLTAVFFWRICLDEAQMVESATAKAAEVALHLNCKYRWCVTGTPLQRGLEDIYGLLLFLGVYPYCQRSWWKALLYEPYKQGNKQPLYNLLAKIMWRSAKNDVIDELQLPKQEETVKWLTFSPVEHHFYSRQHEECARTTLKMLSSWERSDTKLNTIDRHTVHQMLTPLLRLRQACCHPQAVRGGFLSMQKSTLTMDQLLESLIVKAKLECEEAHRQLLFAFNGLAGVHIIKDEWPAAVELYRDAMRSWTEHQHTFRTDALQKLHTLCNLSDVLSQGHPGCSRTLRDDNLKNEVNEIKEAYMARVNTQVTTAQQNLDVIKANIAEMVKMVDFKAPWWMSALQRVSSGTMESDLLQRVHDELSSTELEMGSFQHRFSDVRGLQYVISSKLDTIMSTHDNLLLSLERLNIQPTPQMVRLSAECCLRPAKDHSHATRCKFCEVDDIFTEYESRLFGHQGMKGVTEEIMQPDEPFDWHRHGNTGGLRAESEVEKVLKVLFNFLKHHKILPDVHQEGRCHLNTIEALRKEFKFLRSLWFALRERISSLDELDMCTTRLRLLLPGEPVTDDIHVIHPLQVEQQRLKFVSDRLIAQTELRKKLGQLLYLTNLAKTQSCHDGKNPEPCPVCTKQLGIQWSVFSCGHCVCCQCAWELLRQAGIGPRQRNVQVKCPMCRIPTLSREISYVSTTRDQTDSCEEKIVVKGSHSTKVEAVVRTLLTIRMTDDTAKCLVFSTWQDVLGVVGRALEENGINYRHITGGSKHFQTNLKAFKQNPDACVLLLPLHSGSNGLNIIEATHVLLVEPALNPAHELQAVGRVHRIGQTKPTHVYRFIIRGTVESRMFCLLQTKPTTSVRPGSHDNENSSLTVGDLAALFTAEWEEEQQRSDPFDQEAKVDHLQSQ